MLPFASHNTIRGNKCSGYSAFLYWLYQKGLVISAIPVQCCPAMKEIVSRFPLEMSTHIFNIFAIMFTGQQVSRNFTICTWYLAPGASDSIKIYVGVYICIESYNFLKSLHVYAQMNRLLVINEYIIVFVSSITTVTNYTVWITAPKRIAMKHSVTWTIPLKPRPKSVVVNFIYSDH